MQQLLRGRAVPTTARLPVPPVAPAAPLASTDSANPTPPTPAPALTPAPDAGKAPRRNTTSNKAERLALAR